MTVVLVLAALLATAGYAHAIARCRAQVAAGKARARLRADAARQIELVAHRWQAHTARLAAALDPLLTDTTAPTAVAGFGDALVAEERVRLALLALDHPRPVEDLR